MQVVVLRDKLEPYFAEGRYQKHWWSWRSYVTSSMPSSRR